MLRNSTGAQDTKEIVFEADQDLYQAPSMRIVMLKSETRTLQISKSARSFQSYVNEMCGYVGLASNTLRFQSEKRDVAPSKIVTQSVRVKVTHTYEFSQSPNKSLRPALVSIYDNQICCDLQIVVNKTKTFYVNKCILAVRSPPLAKMIKEMSDRAVDNGSDPLEPLVIKLDKEPSVGLFGLMLRWLYSASIEIPSNIFEVVQLFFIAHEFKILDLMSRCEHEIINKINSMNVVDLLVLLQEASLKQNQTSVSCQKSTARSILRKCQELLAQTGAGDYGHEMLDQVSTEEDVSDGDENDDDTGNEPVELKSPTELLINDNKDENEEEKIEPQVVSPMGGNDNNDDDLVDCGGEGSFSSPEKAHSLEEQKQGDEHHPNEGGLYRRTVSDEQLICLVNNQQDDDTGRQMVVMSPELATEANPQSMLAEEPNSGQNVLVDRPPLIGLSHSSTNANTRRAANNSASLLKKARTTSSSTSPTAPQVRGPTEQSPESAQFTLVVNQKYTESIDQILETAKTFFLQEFQEVLFDARNERTIEKKLASAPGLLISLFQHMGEQRRRKRHSIKNRVTFSNVEEIQYASGSVGNDASGDSEPIELSADLGNHSEDNFI